LREKEAVRIVRTTQRMEREREAFEVMAADFLGRERR